MLLYGVIEGLSCQNVQGTNRRSESHGTKIKEASIPPTEARIESVMETLPYKAPISSDVGQ